ncbi:MAG TPA: hypothetical protein VGK13_00015 [Methanocellaceae archaeon]
MFDRIKGIFGAEEDEPEELPVELPEVKPFSDMTMETGSEKLRKPDHKKLNINHAGHMRIVARNDEDGIRVGAEALRTARDKKTIYYGEDTISGYLSDMNYLKFLTITGNNDNISSYPVFNIGKPLPARITDVTECENGYEGQLEVYVNGAPVEIFDTMYFKNKNTYVPDKDVTVLISGVAYVLSRISQPKPLDKKDKKIKDKKSPKAEFMGDADLAFRYENGDVDDYVFRGFVQEVREFEVMGKKAQAIKTTLRLRGDSAIEIYVCATENAIREKLQKGDHISGIVWLQGFIVS